MTTSEVVRRVTLKQVADLAGVSVPAASTVLSGLQGSVRVTKSTEERIRHAADALGYRQRRGQLRLAKATHVGRPQSQKIVHVGIIMQYEADISSPFAERNPWNHDVATALELALIGSGTARVSHFNRSRLNEKRISVSDAVHSLIAHGVDALILIDWEQADVMTQHAITLEASKLPFVIVSGTPITASVAHISIDNRSAGYVAALHLIQLGHREIMFLAPVSADWIEQRIEGATAALTAHGLPKSSLMIYPLHRPPLGPATNWTKCYSHTPSAVAASTAAIRSGSAPHAVIGLNDEVALAFMRTASEIDQNTRYAVIGFDDMPEARFAGLTTLRAPREAMGREAAALILQQYHNPSARKQTCLQSDLVVRSSSVKYE